MRDFCLRYLLKVVTVRKKNDADANLVNALKNFAKVELDYTKEIENARLLAAEVTRKLREYNKQYYDERHKKPTLKLTMVEEKELESETGNNQEKKTVEQETEAKEREGEETQVAMMNDEEDQDEDVGSETETEDDETIPDEELSYEQLKKREKRLKKELYELLEKKKKRDDIFLNIKKLRERVRDEIKEERVIKKRRIEQVKPRVIFCEIETFMGNRRFNQSENPRREEQEDNVGDKSLD